MTDPTPLRSAPAASRPPRRFARRTRATILLGAVVLASVAACSGAPDFDRDGAVDRVVDGSGGVIGRQEAECYVDRVVAEVGTAPLGAGAEPEPEQIRALTAIKIDCFGVDKIGATTSLATTPPTSVDGVIPQPKAYGDDPALDALWDQCEAGSGLACDQLFDQAPIGSDYEQFAGTCGNRTQELRCADVYTATTASSAPAPPTTLAGP